VYLGRGSGSSIPRGASAAVTRDRSGQSRPGGVQTDGSTS